MIDSSVIGVASAIFTSLEDTEVLPFLEIQGRDLIKYCEEVDLDEGSIFRLYIYLIIMKYKTPMKSFCSSIRQSTLHSF